MALINPVGLCTLIYKEILRYYKVIGQTLLAPVVSNGLFLIVFGITMRDRTVTSGNVQVTYLQFLVPGLVMMGVITNSFQNSCSSLIIAKYNKTATDLLIIPLSGLDITLAFLTAAVTRGTLVGIVTYLTAVFFIDININNFWITAGALLLSSGSFAMIGAILGMKYYDYDQVATIQNFILFPLSFLGGVFYSIHQLPHPFNLVAEFNPVTYMINALRYGILGVTDVNIKAAFIIMIIIFTATFYTAYRMFRSGNGLR